MRWEQPRLTQLTQSIQSQCDKATHPAWFRRAHPYLDSAEVRGLKILVLRQSLRHARRILNIGINIPLLRIRRIILIASYFDEVHSCCARAHGCRVSDPLQDPSGNRCPCRPRSRSDEWVSIIHHLNAPPDSRSTRVLLVAGSD